MQTLEILRYHHGVTSSELFLKLILTLYISFDVFSFCVQDPILFTGTIADNISYGMLGVPRSEIEEVARQANCEFIWTMPQGFDTESEYYAVPDIYSLFSLLKLVDSLSVVVNDNA